LAHASFEPNLHLYKHPNHLLPVILLVSMTYEDGTNRVFQNIGTENTDADKSPKRKNTTFTAQGEFEIKNHLYGEETAQYIRLLKKLQIKKSKIKKNILVDSQFHNHENNGLNYKNSSVSRMT
jgi:hypothetical protein